MIVLGVILPRVIRLLGATNLANLLDVVKVLGEAKQAAEDLVLREAQLVQAGHVLDFAAQVAVVEQLKADLQGAVAAPVEPPAEKAPQDTAAPEPAPRPEPVPPVEGTAVDESADKVEGEGSALDKDA